MGIIEKLNIYFYSKQSLLCLYLLVVQNVLINNYAIIITITIGGYCAMINSTLVHQLIQENIINALTSLTVLFIKCFISKIIEQLINKFIELINSNLIYLLTTISYSNTMYRIRYYLLPLYHIIGFCK